MAQHGGFTVGFTHYAGHLAAVGDAGPPQGVVELMLGDVHAVHGHRKEPLAHHEYHGADHASGHGATDNSMRRRPLAFPCGRT